MNTYDVKKAHRALYAPSVKDFALVEVPPLQFLAIDGRGDPNSSPVYAAAVEALYSVAYTLKFAGKREGRDWVVAPLEGLWRADDPSVFTARAKSHWEWTMLIHQPEWVTAGEVRTAVDEVHRKKGLEDAARLELRTISEGTSAQILHVGSYDDEAPTLHRLHHEWMPAHGLTWNGDHHEIYLSDPRRVAPEKLRTVLRQPVRTVSG